MKKTSNLSLSFIFILLQPFALVLLRIIQDPVLKLVKLPNLYLADEQWQHQLPLHLSSTLDISFTMAPSAISPERTELPSHTLSSLTTSYDSTLRFYLNGTRIVLDDRDIDPEITLLEYLRGIGLTGTKLGCAEGGCGACTVVVSQYNPTTKKIYHASVNACLAPLVSVDGMYTHVRVNG